MSIQVTVGEISNQADTTQSRGNVTVALAESSGRTDEESMIEVRTGLRGTTCTVKLTIAEAEILQNALDSLILEAAVPGLGTRSIARGDY